MLEGKHSIAEILIQTNYTLVRSTARTYHGCSANGLFYLRHKYATAMLYVVAREQWIV